MIHAPHKTTLQVSPRNVRGSLASRLDMQTKRLLFLASHRATAIIYTTKFEARSGAIERGGEKSEWCVEGAHRATTMCLPIWAKAILPHLELVDNHPSAADCLVISFLAQLHLILAARIAHEKIINVQLFRIGGDTRPRGGIRTVKGKCPTALRSPIGARDIRSCFTWTSRRTSRPNSRRRAMEAGDPRVWE